MIRDKTDFLKNDFISQLKHLDPAKAPLWGKMNVQQMIEHISREALRNANGRLKFDTILTPPENLGKMRDFLMSEKPYRENTINPLMSETPLPLKNHSLGDAISELEEELAYFFEVFEKDPNLVIRNPFFGDLNYQQMVQLLYKHALHHLKQFGVDAESN